MKKKSMIISAAALSAVAGGAAFFAMNKNARKKAENMIEFAVDETKSYFEEM